MASNHLVDAPSYMDPHSAVIVDGPGTSTSMYNDENPLPAQSNVCIPSNHNRY